MGQGPSAGRDGSGSDSYRSQGRLSSVHAALDSLRFSQQDQAPVRKLLGSPKYPTAVLSVGQLERLIEYGLGGNGPGVLTRITQPDSDTDLPNVDEAFKAIENTGTSARNPILEEGMQRGMWSFDVHDK